MAFLGELVKVYPESCFINALNNEIKLNNKGPNQNINLFYGKKNMITVGDIEPPLRIVDFASYSSSANVDV